MKFVERIRQMEFDCQWMKWIFEMFKWLYSIQWIISSVSLVSVNKNFLLINEFSQIVVKYSVKPILGMHEGHLFFNCKIWHLITNNHLNIYKLARSLKHHVDFHLCFFQLFFSTLLNQMIYLPVIRINAKWTNVQFNRLQSHR